MVIDYRRSRERAEPQNAFYQEGEVANEGARVCIDAGDLKMAEQRYRKGFELGMKEPAPRTHPPSLWAFRLRVDEQLRLGRARATATLDAFNVFNGNTILAERRQQNSTNANTVSAILAPRVLRFGLRVTF